MQSFKGAERKLKILLFLQMNVKILDTQAHVYKSMVVIVG